MFAKIRMALSVIGLLSILAGCSGQSTVDLATPSPAKIPDSSPGPQDTPNAQPSLAHVSFDCQNIQEISVEECQALIALYERTDGDHWADNSGWLGDQTPCSWYGVICEQGRIVELQLYYNQLAGILPPEIGNLIYLKSLYLDSNQLGGPVPPEIGGLANLQVARLGGNQFSSIPAEIADLKSLIFLEL